jgi:hypothetical protein
MWKLEEFKCRRVERTVPVTVCVSVTTGVSVDVEVPILKQEHAAETWDAG